MRRIILKSIPWLITIAALYYAFQGIEWKILFEHIATSDLRWVTAAILLTSLSYILRSRRWQFLFIDKCISYWDATRVLFAGFFMNNILPAKTGELVRAHMGSRTTGKTRTHVLATIAAERIADGLTLSAMFVAFAVGLGDDELSNNMLIVAWVFAGITVGVILTLVFRKFVFSTLHLLIDRFENKVILYFLERIEVFINGLSPLLTPSKVPYIVLWSFIIWFVELLVFVSVSQAFGGQLTFAYCILFLVSVNFSSLIPAAPGGIGVIEYVASVVLVSVGVSKELALAMIMTQHVIQYIVVGIPGAIVLATWKVKFPSSSIVEASNHGTG